MDNSRIASSTLANETEEVFEGSLRPRSFSEIVGRENEKKTLKVMIDSAKKRNRSLDHILFHGPPGLGKTSFAHVIANEMGHPFHITNGTVLSKPGDLAAILTSLEENSILFIDEIHRLKQNIEEILYPVMEDRVLDIIIGKGPSAKNFRIDLPEFTIIGATTKLAKLSNPLRDRFGLNLRLDFYTEEDLKNLVIQKAKMLNIGIDEQAAAEIGRRSRMTARIAIRVLKRARDIAVIANLASIDQNVVSDTLELFNIDKNGLDETDREILRVIKESFDNKPVGLNTLSAALLEEADTIESVYEPFLIKKGFLKRTPKGRIITDLAIREYF